MQSKRNCLSFERLRLAIEPRLVGLEFTYFPKYWHYTPVSRKNQFNVYLFDGGWLNISNLGLLAVLERTAVVNLS